MRLTGFLRAFFPALLTAFWVAACGEDAPTSISDDPGPTAGPLADFSLPDVNPTSPRYSQVVSPRDYEGKISAWYFGHAT